MNKIVREHYPVSRLPEDLRVQLSEGALVTISIQEERSDPSEIMSLEQIFALTRNTTKRDIDEIDAELNTARDEWQERD